MILTPKQKRVWKFVVAFNTRHGETPTYSEIRNKTGVGYSCIQSTYDRLLEEGYIKKMDGEKRGIIVLPY